MINKLLIENYKSFKKLDLKLGKLNFFIGTNASGKSNLFDALRVLQGIGNGFTIDEILNGKPKGPTSAEWLPIRGGSSQATFMGADETSDTCSFVVHLSGNNSTTKPGFHKAIYKMTFSPSRGSISEEHLYCDGDIYNSNPSEFPKINNYMSSPILEARYYRGKRGRQPQLIFEKNRPILYQLKHKKECTKEDKQTVDAIALALADMQRIDPSPSFLRDYSHARKIQRMGEHGENFAALIKSICDDPLTKSAYLGWLQELRPTELDDVTTLEGAVGERLFALKESAHTFPAPVLSDGTLRFAAITATFFQPDMPSLLTIEEIENGIHASRLRLLIELLKNQISTGKTQIMATTHSPVVLAWLKPEDYETTFFCKRNELTGESQILPLVNIPRFNEVIKKQPLNDLFAEGWLETAL